MSAPSDAPRPPLSLRHTAKRTSDQVRALLHGLPHDDPLRITLRTYSLSLSLSLGPALLAFVQGKSRPRKRLLAVLRRELSHTGFAFAITVAVGGGAFLGRLLDVFTAPASPVAENDGSAEGQEGPDSPSVLVAWLASLSSQNRALLANALSSSVAIALLQAGYRRRPWTARIEKAAVPLTVPDGSSTGRMSPTLDLTLLFFVRAVDVLVQRALALGCTPRTPALKSIGPQDDDKLAQQMKEMEEKGFRKRRRDLAGYIDAFVFWASSARIMWCFFYEPDRLPTSYVKWINALAEIDPRLVEALRAIRVGTFSYVRGTAPANDPRILTSLAADLGCPPAWGDPKLLPAYGGASASAMYRAIGVMNRSGVGGIPCELVHGDVGRHSCTGNATRRGLRAFLKAILIYLPVHILPVLFTRPQHLLQLSRILPRLLSVLRSSAFLSTFVSSIWFAVCTTRTLALARLAPRISHDFYDGPMGCTLAGSLVCGSSIWIESSRRRGEMALYVLPRAVRASLPENWIRGGHRGFRVMERAVFVASLASLLTTATHQPDTLRGVSRWTMSFITNGNIRKAAHTPQVAPRPRGGGQHTTVVDTPTTNAKM